MHERGQVIAVGTGTVDVRMAVGASCGGCSACSTLPTGESLMQGVLDVHGAEVGDTVEVLVPDAVRSRAAAAVFVVPVVCLLVGYLAGFLLGEWVGVSPDLTGLATALIAAGLAVIGVKRAERRLASDEQYLPKVNAISARGHDRI